MWVATAGSVRATNIKAGKIIFEGILASGRFEPRIRDPPPQIPRS